MTELEKYAEEIFNVVYSSPFGRIAIWEIYENKRPPSKILSAQQRLEYAKIESLYEHAAILLGELIDREPLNGFSSQGTLLINKNGLEINKIGYKKYLKRSKWNKKWEWFNKRAVITVAIATVIINAGGFLYTIFEGSKIEKQGNKIQVLLDSINKAKPYTSLSANKVNNTPKQ